jgi:hypothetical protein
MREGASSRERVVILSVATLQAFARHVTHAVSPVRLASVFATLRRDKPLAQGDTLTREPVGLSAKQGALPFGSAPWRYFCSIVYALITHGVYGEAMPVHQSPADSSLPVRGQ